MASYPSSVKTFTTKLAGDAINAAHVNDLQDEVVAIEDGLLNGFGQGLVADTTDTYDLGTTSVRWRDLFLSSNLDVSGLGTNVIGTGGTGENTVHIKNTTAGAANSASLRLYNDTGAAAILRAHASTFTTAAPYAANGVTLEAALAGGLSIGATHASGTVTFYAGGTTARGSIATTGAWTFNGDGTFAKTGAADATLSVSGAAGQYRSLSLNTTGTQRFSVGINTTAEGGSDAGSDFYIARHNDAGAAVDLPFNIDRSSGAITSPTQPRCRAYVTAATTAVADSATLAAVSLTAETTDVGAMHSTSSNQSRITVPTDGAGFYLITGQASWAADADGVRYIKIVQDGTTTLAAGEMSPPGAVAMSQSIVTCATLAAGAYVELHVAQTAGGNLDLLGGATGNTHLCVVKLW